MRTLTIYVPTLLLFLFTASITRAQGEGTLIKTSLDSEKIYSLETLPNGIIAGEYDTRTWRSPFNGIFISKNLGTTWETLGLADRGISDLDYENNRIFAATYYYLENETGLFISSDNGATFSHFGPTVSTSSVAASDETVALGTYSHGLWLSNDLGITWEQKIGDGSGWYGPDITSLTSDKEIFLTATPDKVYLSTDSGSTWNEIPFLEGKQINSLYIHKNIFLAGSKNDEGLFFSNDFGTTWQRSSNWGTFPVGKITYFKGLFYAQKIDQAQQDYSFFISNDNGRTWSKSTLTPAGRAGDLTQLFSYPSYFFLSLELDGVYRYSIPQANPSGNPFLAIPWDNQNSRELVDKITAYFDHEYPLGEYINQNEPDLVKETTLNFMGFEEATPLIYYSGHNGIDFALPYNTQVIAPASGYAKYYYCADCGHSIKIDHGNGYETTFMHLQKDGLITQNSNGSLWIEKGDVVGLVGMTGNTSGPHLHMSVMRDINQNGIFDDYPDGLVDPFGWHDPYNLDPWEHFSWLDSSGAHTGSESSYLWQDPLSIAKAYLTKDQPTVNIDNKTMTFNSKDLEKNPLTAVAMSFIKPKIPVSQFELKYIEDSSFSVTALNHYEEKIGSLDEAATLTIDLTNLDLNNIIKDSLKIFFWNEISKQWEPLLTILDLPNNTATATTTHLSHFALLGQKTSPLPPESNLIVNGVNIDGWYVTHPEISIQSQDNNQVGLDKVFFSINNGLDWYVYQNPFTLEQEGIIMMLFRAQDLSGNLEETKKQMLKVDTLGKWKGKILVKGSNFEVSQ